MFATLGISIVLSVLASQLALAHPMAHKRAATPTVATAWYAGWNGAPLEELSWEKYTQLTYSFAITTEDVNELSIEDSKPEMLPQFVQMAKSKGVKPSVSIGGWTGSRFFSNHVATPENRTAFVKTVTGFVSQYQLEAIDFDWEYPNKAGIGCNAKTPQDAANFLAFLQELRKDPIMNNITISAATAITPFNGPNDTPLTDVKEFADVLDYIAIMNYDIWGPWSTTTGPNAPLKDSCAPTAAQQGSAEAAIKAWTGAGIPPEKLVLGVPSYGRQFNVNQASASGSNNSTLNVYATFIPASAGNTTTTTTTTDVCGNPDGGPVVTMDFAQLIQKGFLDTDGQPACGFEYTFDECSQTPFIYDPETETMITYDDAQSMTAKGAYIKQLGLAGFAMWETNGDSNNILLDAVRAGAGFETEDGQGSPTDGNVYAETKRSQLW